MKEDFYADEARLAVHLEMEWSDFLYPPAGQARSRIAWPDPLTHRAAPTFYQEVGRRVCGWLALRNLTPASHCEVGGGAGRMLYELANALPSLRELSLVEPSDNLARWAHTLLAETDEIHTFPAVAGPRQAEYRRAYARPRPIASNARKLSIHRQSIEQAPLADGACHLVTCLGVVDRHPDPAGLLRSLRRILAPGGLLVVASPLDFRERYTPRSAWVDDLDALFAPDDWTNVGTAEIPFDVRSSRRCWTRYVAQVRGEVKRSGVPAATAALAHA